MKPLLFVAIAIALTVLPVVAAPQRYVRAEENPNHELVITPSAGPQIVVPRGRLGALEEEVQQTFGSVAIASDGQAVGWLAYYPNCCTSYPIPAKVEVFSGGTRRTFNPAIVAWDWCFVDGSAKLAALSTTVHGPQNAILQLWDIASGKLLEDFTWMEDQTYPRAPAWVMAIRAEHSRDADSKTHRCNHD
jgi:hypothetical protein